MFLVFVIVSVGWFIMGFWGEGFDLFVEDEVFISFGG